MNEYVNVRASEIFDQDELVAFLKSRFRTIVRTRPRQTKVPRTETVEVKIPSNSAEFDEIRQFIEGKRKQGLDGFEFPIGEYLREYSPADLQQAEVLKLDIRTHFDFPGEESGTIYETLCHHCNFGRQVSELILDLRRVPRDRDISETIARVEWVVSSKFGRAFLENMLTGAEFRGIFDRRNPTNKSEDWKQLWVTGHAGRLAGATKLGRDPFKRDQVSWRCPLGHAIATQFLSEIYLRRDAWDGSDIAVTSDLFGQGRGFIRPFPLIMISQRMYRVLQDAGLKGISYEVAHLI